MPGPRQSALAALCAAVLVFPLGACAPDDPLARAREQQTAGDYAGSLDALRAHVDAHPDDAEAQLLYGRALARTGRPSAAVWALRQAMQDPKWMEPAAFQLAAGALRTGNPAEAVEVIGRVLELEPDNVDALALRAEAKASLRTDYTGALADADRALQLDPDQRSAQVTRAVALLGLERADEAEAALKQLERQASEADFGSESSARFCLTRATFLREKGDPAASEAQLEKCLKEFPTSDSIVGEAVRWYDANGKLERSVEILREALRTDPLASWHRVALSERLLLLGKPDEAEKVLREGTEQDDRAQQVVAWVDLANYFVGREQPNDAVEALEKAIALSPDPRVELLFQHAETLLDAGRLAEARAAGAKLALPAYRELIEARVLLAEGKPLEALPHFDAGLQLWPANAVARYYSARASEAAGDFDRAIEEYRYAVRIDSRLSDARWRLARLHEAERRWDYALTIARMTGSDEAPDPEAERVGLRVLGRLGRLAEARDMIARQGARPDDWGKAVAAMAEGTRARLGPAETAKFLRATEHLDLREPRNAPALRQLVISLLDAGDAAGAAKAAGEAVAQHPDNAELNALRGLSLERADAAAARAAYAKALALDAENVPALAGEARLAAAAGDTDAALERYARAAAADRAELGDPEARRAYAELLVSLGRAKEAEQQLAALLALDPYDGAAAARLAALRLEREADAVSQETLSYAERAARFGSGAERYELLARVHRARGDAKRADEALKLAAEAKARAEQAAGAPAS
jgi:tetratricopeptide (TPR) repeat protein